MSVATSRDVEQKEALVASAGSKSGCQKSDPPLAQRENRGKQTTKVDLEAVSVS